MEIEKVFDGAVEDIINGTLEIEDGVVVKGILGGLVAKVVEGGVGWIIGTLVGGEVG